jgi:two-component system, NarL family, invasion response regulator UvrY
MRILIADDHPIVRHGVRQVLAEDPEMEVVGEAKDGDEALRLARALQWDVAVMDFSMPGRSGFDLLGDLRREFPGRPVIVLSIHAEQLHAARVLKAGGAGYLNKSSAPQELARAVRKVAAGGRYVSAALAELLASDLASDAAGPPHEQLSDREYRVMWLLASGRQINQIARELLLRPSTVSTYRTRVFRKLRLRNNAELVQYAVRHQLVE